MTGTAAEVTPLAQRGRRRDRGRPDHARDPGGVPGHRARPQRALGPVARLRHARAGRSLSTGTREIPLARPLLDEREEELVVEVLRSGRLSLGPTIERFEELIAERVGAPFAAAVSSGTARAAPPRADRRARPGRRGDHLAALVRGSRRTASSSRGDAGLRRRRPAHAEPRPGGPRGGDHRAHEGGRGSRHVRLPVRARRDPAICDRHGLTLIEDAAEALGAEYNGNPIGSHGVSGVFGFYRTSSLRPVRAGSSSRTPRRSGSSCRACATRAATTAAARGSTTCGSGSTTAGPTCRRRSGSGSWRSSTGCCRCGRRWQIGTRGCSTAWRSSRSAPTTPTTCAPGSVYVVAVPAGVDRDRVMAELRAQGIGTAEYVPCVHLQPYMRETYGFAEGMCPVAEDVASRTLALPLLPAPRGPLTRNRVVESPGRRSPSRGLDETPSLCLRARAARARCCLLGRARTSPGTGTLLRPCLGTTSALRRRAPFRPSLLGTGQGRPSPAGH